MKPIHWIILLAGLLLGAALGLLYGWALQPVEYVDVTPGILRADYRADYVLMVAEAHQREQDSGLSARRLAMLGSQPPARTAEEALRYAVQNGFTETETTLLRGLLNAMQTYAP